MNDWDTMIAELGAVPHLPGAQCRGRWELFDAATTTNQGRPPRKVQEARQAAADLCAQCPALNACAAWLSTLPAHQRPLGVTAGQIVTASELSLFQRELAERAEHFASLRRQGLSLRAIAAATGSNEATVRRALTRPCHSTQG